MSTTENRAAGNLSVVGGIYEAFARGDIEFILGQIADDCAWESWLDNHGQKAGLPPMKPLVMEALVIAGFRRFWARAESVGRCTGTTLGYHFGGRIVARSGEPGGARRVQQR